MVRGFTFWGALISSQIWISSGHPDGLFWGGAWGGIAVIAMIFGMFIKND